MTYILKDKQEPQRLDEQSRIEEFSLEQELKNIRFTPNTKVLDAGCGSGVLCRYLEESHPEIVVHGCDISDHSLAHGRQESLSRSTKFYRHDLLVEPTAEKYDLIINRLVFHHLDLTQQQQMLKNFRESLRQDGRLCVIDLDGLFLNLGSMSEKLHHQMLLLSSQFQGHLTSARLLPKLLSTTGFKDIRWEVVCLDFQGESRKKEVDQWSQRFESALPFYVKAFGSEFEARAFFRRYLEEAARDDVTLFYNKFIVTGVRDLGDCL